MPQRAGSLRRSAGEWGVRGALAAAAALLGGLAVTHSLAFPSRTAQPERAYALAPGDARIGASVAARLSGEQGAAAHMRAEELAHSALWNDATAVSAATTLGLNAQTRGETRKAQQWFNYAERLSRRDLRTQLWMIEAAVERNDISGALRHYDIALRTSRSAADLLFPVLRTAAKDPAIRTALVRALSAKPNWSEPFISQAASLGDDPRAIATLFEELTRVGGDVPARAQSLVVTRMVEAGQVDAAWTYYRTIRPNAFRTQSRDPRFAAQLVDPTPFDWQPINEDGISVSLQASGRQSGLVDFSAPSAIGGLLLRQLQMLPSGKYLFEAHSTGGEQPDGSSPYWALTCMDGREVGRVPLSGGGNSGGNVRTVFMVPDNCSTQYLSLNAQPSDAVGGTVGQVDRAFLRPQ